MHLQCVINCEVCGGGVHAMATSEIVMLGWLIVPRCLRFPQYTAVQYNAKHTHSTYPYD